MNFRSLLSFLVLLFVFQFSFAGNFPTDKGSKMFSGNFSIYSQGGEIYENDNERLLTIQTNPNINYFLYPGFSVGIKSILTYESIGGGSWGLGPSVYYYINGRTKPSSAIKDMIYRLPYITASYIYASSLDSDTKTKESTINLGFGFLAILDDYVGINLEISFDHYFFNISSVVIEGNKVSFAIGINLFQY